MNKKKYLLLSLIPLVIILIFYFTICFLFYNNTSVDEKFKGYQTIIKQTDSGKVVYSSKNQKKIKNFISVFDQKKQSIDPNSNAEFVANYELIIYKNGKESATYFFNQELKSWKTIRVFDHHFTAKSKIENDFIWWRKPVIPIESFLNNN